MAEPKRYTEVTVSDEGRVSVNHIHDYRGSQHLPNRPTELECDYCCKVVTKLFCRPVRPFCVTALRSPKGQRGSFAFDGGNWNSCEACEPLVSGQFSALLGLRSSRRYGTTVEYFRNIYQTVFDATEEFGPVLEWNSGDVFPVRPA